MLRARPAWAVDDDASIRREVEPYREMTSAQLWDATTACARAAVWALGFHEQPAEALGYVEPLPPSSVSALARLRAQR